MLLPLKDKLKTLPQTFGCYLMKDRNDKVIYVGKAINLRKRVNQYFVGVHDYKTTKLVSNIVDFEFMITTSEKEALLLEYNLIKKYKPRYNIMYMDDKSYPYIKVTNERYPRIVINRDLKKDQKAQYFGPFPNATYANLVVQLINEIFPLKKCVNEKGKKKCLYFHLNQCLGMCEEGIDEKKYQLMIKEAIDYMHNKDQILTNYLLDKMNDASSSLNFELAKKYKDYLQAIDYFNDKQQIVLKDINDVDVINYYVSNGYIGFSILNVRGGILINTINKVYPIIGDVEDIVTTFLMQYYLKYEVATKLLVGASFDDELLSSVLNVKVIKVYKGQKKALLDKAFANAKEYLEYQIGVLLKQDTITTLGIQELNLMVNNRTHHIELFDNSHISGTNNVSGMVVFIDGVKSPNMYRRFKLNDFQDDLASMYEALYRHYLSVLKNDRPLCDILIVDGGVNQINVAKRVKKELELDIMILGLSKDNHHETSKLINEDLIEFSLDKKSNLYFLLVQMQDEVHRYAISYHQLLRKKQQTASQFMNIPFIKNARKEKLVSKFSTYDNLLKADVKDIQLVIGDKIGLKVFEYIHNN
ncbi:MAG: excinuclease ABC subunit UvrC [Erysipelotrichaceae bacterium]